MLKLFSIFGTRPEAIKMGPFLKELKKHSTKIESCVCVTAQHREMLDQVLPLFGIRPHYDLNIMQNSQSPSQVFGRIMELLHPILIKESPDWVLVQGDTTTVAAASMAAFYAGIKVGHIEAGLRSFNRYHPFPEEINRKITTIVSNLHFAPTEKAKENLLREGIPENVIKVTGNPVIDALFWAIRQPISFETMDLFRKIGTDGRRPDEFNNKSSASQRLILVTAHRRENFGEPLKQICMGLRKIALDYAGDVQIIYPVHLNPTVQSTVYGILKGVPWVKLCQPLDYLTFVQLMKNSFLVLTDSGGIQEEAPGLDKPVLVLRNVTERYEAVEAGTVKVIGTNEEDIVVWTKRFLDDPVEYGRMANAVNPYGDGHASERIVEAILNYE